MSGLTADMLRAAVKKLSANKPNPVDGFYTVYMDGDLAQDAFELGLAPFCPLTDDGVIFCAHHHE